MKRTANLVVCLGLSFLASCASGTPQESGAASANTASANTASANTASADPTSEVTAPGVVPSTQGALNIVSAAANAIDAALSFMDPAASYLLQNSNTVGNPNMVSQDPNRAACKADVTALRKDEQALKQSPEFQAVLKSASLAAVEKDAGAIRQDQCFNVISATAACKTAIDQFETDLTSFQNSAELKALQASTPYLAVVADAKQADQTCIAAAVGLSGHKH